MKLDSSIAAVVTGGASGLGEGTARAIAATGAKVALFGSMASAGSAGLALAVMAAKSSIETQVQ